MHQTSFPEIVTFIENYLDRDSKLSIIDLSGLSVKDYDCSLLFDEEIWDYKVVSLKKDGWGRKIKKASADVIVTGQNLERIEFFWEAMKEIGRILIK